MLLPERTLRRLFDLGVIIKGVDGAFELAGGIMFVMVNPQTLSAIILSLTAHELSEDPSDLVANLLRHSLGHVSSNTTLFAGAYLLGHGIAKIVLAVCLVRGKLWAYPAALWFLGVFVLYQIYRIVLTLSLGLIALTVFDLIVMSLTWHEYHVRTQARLTSA